MSTRWISSISMYLAREKLFQDNHRRLHQTLIDYIGFV